MFALEGEEVGITLFSDGHIEIEPPDGRPGVPSQSELRGRIYQSDEEFFAALKNNFRD
jgi:hypothetical protein